jgi:hypothetical protein
MRSFHIGATYVGRSIHRGQVLAHQSGFPASGPYFLDTERLSRDKGQGEGRPENLAAPFTTGAINDDHELLLLCAIKRVKATV